MRTVTRRIAKLEHQFGIATDTPQIRYVVRRAGSYPDENKCLQVLEECGFLGPQITMVNLCAIPDGLNEQEMERFLRKRGAELCYPRNAPNFGVPIAGVQRDDDPAE
jgi:hypothetical protein